MLDLLNHESIGRYHLRVEQVGQARFFDQRDFALYLLDPHVNKTQIFRGLYNAGRPSIYVPRWIDGEFVEDPSLALPLSRGGMGWGEVYAEVAEKIGALIPPGGRFWLAYESFGGEGELMLETRLGLSANVPLVTTPIGFLLYRADCWLGMRDWYFPEGGREGSRKLQGNKAVNAEHRRVRATETASELEKFLDAPAQNETEHRAQMRARTILLTMKSTAGKRTKIFTKE